MEMGKQQLQERGLCNVFPVAGSRKEGRFDRMGGGVLAWERQVVGGFGSHGKVNSGLDCARAKFAEPIDTVRLPSGPNFVHQCQAPFIANMLAYPFPWPRAASTLGNAEACITVKLVETRCDPCFSEPQASGNETDPGVRASSTHAVTSGNPPSGGPVIMWGPSLSY
jgi:hypothetical protein